MKDFLGNELTVGDPVIIIQNSYRKFQWGIIQKIGASKVTVVGLSVNPDRWPSDVIKITDGVQ